MKQAKQIIAENEKAVTQQPVQQESQNVDETPTQKESKKPEKKTETSGKKFLSTAKNCRILII